MLWRSSTPVNVKDVLAFLGLASYYRHYIPSFSTLAAPMTLPSRFFDSGSPMTNLTRLGVDLVWDDACEVAFMTLKAALVSAPVLAYHTREGHFTLSTDASRVRTGPG